MPLKTILFGIFALSHCQCCPQQSARQSAAETTATRPSVTMRPATVSHSTASIGRDAWNISGRIGWLRASLIQFHQDYIVNEGYTRRGARFQRLAGAIELGQKKEPMTEYDALILLGPPDYGDGKKYGSQFIYLFDRTGHQDGYVEFNFNGEGKLENVLWDDASKHRFNRPFPAWKFVPHPGELNEP
jgi:hypothetical protein